MSARIYCKDCKDTIINPENAHLQSCKCGKTMTQRLVKGYAVSPGSNYCLVDDQGNEIMVKEAPQERVISMGSPPNRSENPEIIEELMLALHHQIEVMESLSQGGRFSPVVNQDLLAHFLWLQAALRWKIRRIEKCFAVLETADDQIRQLFERVAELERSLEALRGSKRKTPLKQKNAEG